MYSARANQATGQHGHLRRGKFRARAPPKQASTRPPTRTCTASPTRWRLLAHRCGRTHAYGEDPRPDYGGSGRRRAVRRTGPRKACSVLAPRVATGVQSGGGRSATRPPSRAQHVFQPEQPPRPHEGCMQCRWRGRTCSRTSAACVLPPSLCPATQEGTHA